MILFQMVILKNVKRLNKTCSDHHRNHYYDRRHQHHGPNY